MKLMKICGEISNMPYRRPNNISGQEVFCQEEMGKNPKSENLEAPATCVRLSQESQRKGETSVPPETFCDLFRVLWLLRFYPNSVCV